VVSTYPGVYPPSLILANAWATVSWRGVQLSLSSSANTGPVGSTVSLTATTSDDVGPSPFYTEVFDTTTQSVLAECGTGTSCTALVSMAVAATHRFVALEASYATGFPPTNIQATSLPMWVIWSSSGWWVTVAFDNAGNVVATTNRDVGPTPYYIEIFEERMNGDGSQGPSQRIAFCGAGTSCTGSPDAAEDLVAFISTYDTTLPPANIQASSAELFSPRLIG
jgi:hypothetical protein